MKKATAINRYREHWFRISQMSFHNLVSTTAQYFDLKKWLVKSKKSILHSCWLCEFTKERIPLAPKYMDWEQNCEKCPIQWIPIEIAKTCDGCFCEHPLSPYEKWKDAETQKERQKLAKKISLLPELKK